MVKLKAVNTVIAATNASRTFGATKLICCLCNAIVFFLSVGLMTEVDADVMHANHVSVDRRKAK